jgi:hypothetical protein
MDTEKSYAVISPAGDPKVGEDVFRILGIAVDDKIKLGLHDRWLRNHELRSNQHWKAKSNQVPLVSANLLYTHIQRTTNTLTDNEPTFNVVPVGELREGAEKDSLSDLQRTTEHWWRDQEQQDILESSVINGETYGIAIEKVIFNPNLEYNLGEAETIPVDPFHFGWYPPKLAAIRDLQTRDVLLHYYSTPVRSLRAKYPHLADKIKSGDEMLKELRDDERREVAGEGSGTASVFTTIASTVRELINFGTSGSEDEEETLLVEAWVRDRTKVTEDKEVEQTVIDEVTGQTKTIMVKQRETRPKYTGEIRYILACSGNVVLEDKDNPNINPDLPRDAAMSTYLYDKFPFSGANSVKDTSNAWGQSDFSQLEAINMEVDKSLSQFVVEKDRSARKKFVNPMDSGVPNEHITNYVGILNPTSAEASQGLRWIDPPQSSVDYDKAVQVFKDFFFLIAGTFDLDQAQTGGREVIAYKAIAALLERAATMMRGKIRSYSRLIRDRGRMYLSHVMNFYNEERWITYKDQDGNDKTKPIIGSSLAMPAKLTVVSGSTMPISRVQQREEALALFNAKAIDHQELLDKLDWSNRSDVVKRMMDGPLGEIFKKLMFCQVPEPILQYLKKVVEMEPKDLEKALNKGEFPPFMSFAMQLLQSMKGQQPPMSPEQQAKMKEAEAKVMELVAKAEQLAAEKEKTQAETALTVEKAVTEKVEQQVKLAGVGYDNEALKIKRAEVVSAMEADAEGRKQAGIKTGLDFVAKVAKPDRPGQAGWNERGLRSNNVD